MWTDEQRIKAKEKWRAKSIKLREDRLKLPYEELGRHDKRERIFREQNGRCALCDCEPTHNGKPLKFQLDHIDETKIDSKKDNSRGNLRLICPNCHSQTENFASKSWNEETRKIVSVKISKIKKEWHKKLRKCEGNRNTSNPQKVGFVGSTPTTCTN